MQQVPIRQVAGPSRKNSNFLPAVTRRLTSGNGSTPTVRRQHGGLPATSRRSYGGFKLLNEVAAASERPFSGSLPTPASRRRPNGSTAAKSRLHSDSFLSGRSGTRYRLRVPASRRLSDGSPAAAASRRLLSGCPAVSRRQHNGRRVAPQRLFDAADPLTP